MKITAKNLTAFVTPSGVTVQFNAMPLGSEGAPGTFQRLMPQEVLTGYIGWFCIFYIDDIMIFSEDCSRGLMLTDSQSR